MKILVLSDTHIPVAAKKLPVAIENEAKTSSFCLHSGDFIDYAVFETLNAFTDTYGVYGNMDNENVRDKLPDKQIIRIQEITVALIHGSGHPNNLVAYINEQFSSEFINIDIFVFGHSHFPVNKEMNGKIYFNPGSVTDKIFAPYRSYGILEVNGKNIKRRIVKIE